MLKRKIIRYLLIGFIYNLFLSTLIYTMDWLNDEIFHFSFENWDFVEWWFFLSINALILGFLFYVLPTLDAWLEKQEDKILGKIKIIEKEEKE